MPTKPLLCTMNTPPKENKRFIKTMKNIPISAAKRIAKDYGYDQVIIYARRCHTSLEPHGEHLTTYGRNKEHCNAAARIGSYLKREIINWFKN